jgi:hypothetical protein
LPKEGYFPMTLPPNCLPTEMPAMPGDLAAAATGLAAPASAEGADGSFAPFACLLDGSSAPATATATAAQMASTTAAGVAVGPAPLSTGTIRGSFVANNPMLYSAAGYGLYAQPSQLPLAAQQAVTPQLVALAPQPAIEGQPTVENDSGGLTPEAQAEDPDSSESPADPLTEADQLLAYQLVAGQWVVQPPVVSQLPVQEYVVDEGLELPPDINVISDESGVGIDFGTAGKPSLNTYASLPERSPKSSEQNPSGDITQPLGARKDFAQAVAALDPQATTKSRGADNSVPGSADSVLTPRTESVQGVSPTRTVVASPAASSATFAKDSNLSAVPAPVPPKAEKSATVQAETGTQTSDQANVASASESRPLVQGETVAQSSQIVSALRAQNTPPEKIAAPGQSDRAEVASGVNSPSKAEEKKSLVADSKKVSSSGRDVGTSIANRGIPMPYSAANKTPAVEQTAFTHTEAAGVTQTGGTAAADETSAAAAVQAPRLIQEIRTIADRISSIDRNTVEVRFDFSESDRLSVRVEYRDGTVHTTFKTDSNQLREAISHEWQVQTAASESRAYRMADPVFTSNSTALSSQDFSSLGNGSGQSRSSYEQQGGPGFSLPGRSSSLASSSSSAPVAPASVVRPETSRHLHTFA